MTPERREALLNARAGTDAIRTESSRVLTALTKISPAGCEPLRDLKLKQAAYPGLLLKERYRVERELGRGGFGIVYLARDVQLHSRPVVIKFLRGGPVRDDWFEKKFADEIKALALIDHPGVVGALDAGRTPDGIPYLVMQ